MKLMNLRAIWDEMVAEEKNYPSRDLFPWILIIFFSASLFGISTQIEPWYLSIFSFLVAGIATIFSTYYHIFKPLRHYENKYGPTGWGDEWLEKH